MSHRSHLSKMTEPIRLRETEKILEGILSPQLSRSRLDLAQKQDDWGAVQKMQDKLYKKQQAEKKSIERKKKIEMKNELLQQMEEKQREKKI